MSSHAGERPAQRGPGENGDALTTEGHRRVDELLDQLAQVVADRESLMRFATARRAEADLGRVGIVDDEDTRTMFRSSTRSSRAS